MVDITLYGKVKKLLAQDHARWVILGASERPKSIYGNFFEFLFFCENPIYQFSSSAPSAGADSAPGKRSENALYDKSIMDFNSHFEDSDGLLAIDLYNAPVYNALDELELIYDNPRWSYRDTWIRVYHICQRFNISFKDLYTRYAPQKVKEVYDEYYNPPWWMKPKYKPISEKEYFTKKKHELILGIVHRLNKLLI